MKVALSVDTVLSAFDGKISAARWLEDNGNEIDQEIARSVRHSLESVRRDLLKNLETPEVPEELPLLRLAG